MKWTVTGTRTYSSTWIRPNHIEIDIWCRTERFGNSSMTVLMELHGAGTAGDDLRAEIREVQVFVDLDTHTPRPIPDAVKACFAAFDAQPAPILRGDAG